MEDCVHFQSKRNCFSRQRTKSGKSRIVQFCKSGNFGRIGDGTANNMQESLTVSEAAVLTKKW